MSAYQDNTAAWNQVVELIRQHVRPTEDGNDIDGSLRASEAILDAPWLQEHDEDVRGKQREHDARTADAYNNGTGREIAAIIRGNRDLQSVDERHPS